MNTLRRRLTCLVFSGVVLAAILGSCAAAPKAGMAVPPDASVMDRVASSRDTGKGAEKADEGVGTPDLVMELEAPAPLPRSEAAPSTAKSSPGRAAAPAESGLKAGLADDNNQYNYFLEFLRKYAGDWPFRAIPAENRIQLKVVDAQGASVPNAEITLRDDAGREVEKIKTYADGVALLTPPVQAAGRWTATARGPTGPRKIAPPEGSLTFDPSGGRTLQLTLDGRRWSPDPTPLDILFVMDTTGSMGEEIERLKATIEIIRDNLDLAVPRPELRFALVMYKDRGDEYVSRAFPLTSNLKKFQKNLEEAWADGGGDTPEDLEAALADAVAPGIGWNPSGVRLIFVVTDAPAQAYDNAVGYDRSAQSARAQGIKIHTIGTGGLPVEGEYQLRQLAQRTRGKYIFLTYGERGESSGGAVGAVSHHTGSNWSADRLEAVIIRLAKEELALMSGTGVSVPSDEYFEAVPLAGRDPETILDELFGEALVKLLDYSSLAVQATTPTAVLPLSPGSDDPAARRNAERFEARLVQAAATSRRFRLLDRKDLQAVLGELELGLSAIADPAAAAQVGNLLGAELLIIPTLIDAGAATWEVYIKLVRVSSGEILSVSRCRIDRKLGL